MMIQVNDPQHRDARCRAHTTATGGARPRGKLASLVRVRAVIGPGGGPAPTSSVAHLRACASQVTVTTAGRATVTVRLTRVGRRWLVSAVLSW